jgi:hypothetical protein
VASSKRKADLEREGYELRRQLPGVRSTQIVLTAADGSDHGQHQLVGR